MLTLPPGEGLSKHLCTRSIMKTMKDLERSLAISKIVPILVSLSLENPKIIEYIKSVCKLFYGDRLNVDLTGLDAYIFVSNAREQDIWFRRNEKSVSRNPFFVIQNINMLATPPENDPKKMGIPSIFIAISSEAPSICKNKPIKGKQLWGFNYDTHRLFVCSLSASPTTVEGLYGVSQEDTLSSLRNVAIHLGIIT